MQGQSRVAGVLLHPTSLPSGKLDDDVFRWLDFMAAAGLQVWQVLPLGVPQDNLSPYQCYSAFAMNPALLDDVSAEAQVSGKEDAEFQDWYHQEQYWLDDYALFTVLKQQFSSHAWYEWEAPYKQREPEALATFQQQYAEQIRGIVWQQYRLYCRWNEVRDYADNQGIYLFGDMPIFVAHDSADVWANQQYFLLDEQGIPTVVAGVPPDYFSETGQRWGNPHYHWEVMQENGFDWWLKRLENHLALFDLVRVDHFRGLEAVWVIDAHHETAEHGRWQKVLGEQLLETLQNKMGNVPIVAEDLGIITPEVNALRERFQLPGMSVLQFSFDAFDDNPHKPKNISHDRIVYTGTHDNDTTEGWFQSLDEATQHHVMQRLEVNNPKQVTDTLIETALATQAQLAIAPLQDFLQLDSSTRMNRPGTVDDNWQWQFEWQQIPDNLAFDIRKKMLAAGRLIRNY
ncbi:MAG: 4-alpha-glucanotransferase [Thiotrichaceae bacterium]|nr:4-alpha-glucanotransferase [Thiotrichaceae bacterium]